MSTFVYTSSLQVQSLCTFVLRPVLWYCLRNAQRPCIKRYLPLFTYSAHSRLFRTTYRSATDRFSTWHVVRKTFYIKSSNLGPILLNFCCVPQGRFEIGHTITETTPWSYRVCSVLLVQTLPAQMERGRVRQIVLKRGTIDCMYIWIFFSHV